MIISLSILLIISVAANALLIWYIKKMLNELLFSSDNILQLQLSLADFAKHLQASSSSPFKYRPTAPERAIAWSEACHCESCLPYR
jgi:hypothetical protein